MLHNLNDYRFTTIGFDNLFDWLSLTEKTINANASFPPHDIVKLSDEEYRIDLACAGYDSESIDIDLIEGVLTISPKKLSEKERDAELRKVELYRGISKKRFSKCFTLADDVIVEKATMKNGMLSIYLKRVLPKKQNIKIEIEK